MKNMRIMVSAPLIALVAACTSSDPGESDLLTPTKLFDVDIPADADLAGLPQEATDMVAAFRTLNEEDLADPVSSGSATYTGTVGFTVFEDDGGGLLSGGADTREMVLVGDATIHADFAALTVDGSFDSLVGYDPKNNNAEIGVATGTLDISGGVIVDSRYTASFDGDLTLDAETYGVDGLLAGAFVGDGTDSIGVLEGTVTNPDATIDLLNGLFVVSSD